MVQPARPESARFCRFCSTCGRITGNPRGSARCAKEKHSEIIEGTVFDAEKARAAFEAYNKYPEHEKLKSISDKSQLIGSFLEEMASRGFELMSWDDTHKEYGSVGSIKDILADYFGIDTQKLEDEKRTMLEELRTASVTK